MMKSGRWILVGSLVSILMMGGLGLAMGKKVEKEDTIQVETEQKQIETEKKEKVEKGQTGIIPIPKGSSLEQFNKSFKAKRVERKIDYSGISLYFHSYKPSVLVPPCEFLITNPKGRRTGYDPTTGVEYNEIPNSAYFSEGIDDDITGEPGPETKIIDIRQPLDGEYELKVIGTRVDDYTFAMYVCDRENNESEKKFLEPIPISVGVVHTYILNYSSEVGIKLKVFGGFVRNGEKSIDVNKFLSYSNPTQIHTELSAGETSFALFIFYGQTIIPESFKAELNKTSIPHLFSPSPGGFEIVKLDLVKGRNTIILSVDGTLVSGQTTTDKDILVFIVP